MCYEVNADAESLQIALVEYLEKECAELVVKETTEEPRLVKIRW